MTYKLLLQKIKRTDLTVQENIDQLKEMIDVFFKGERITEEEYNELIAMVNKD